MKAWIVAMVALAGLAAPRLDVRLETAPAEQPAPPGADAATQGFDVEKLFASTCGWCHSNAGRTAGRGPQLMGTTLTDAEIIHRIKTGKTGAMPAFGQTFDDAQLRAIVHYIRALKEEGSPK